MFYHTASPNIFNTLAGLPKHAVLHDLKTLFLKQNYICFYSGSLTSIFPLNQVISSAICACNLLKIGYKHHHEVHIWSLLNKVNIMLNIFQSCFQHLTRQFLPTSKVVKITRPAYLCETIPSSFICKVQNSANRRIYNITHVLKKMTRLDVSLVFVPKPRTKFPLSQPTGVTFSTPKAKKTPWFERA